MEVQYMYEETQESNTTVGGNVDSAVKLKETASRRDVVNYDTVRELNSVPLHLLRGCLNNSTRAQQGKSTAEEHSSEEHSSDLHAYDSHENNNMHALNK